MSASADSSEQLDLDIEAVLHQGVITGHLPGVRAIRRSLEISRELSRLGVVVEATPATPSAASIPRQRRPRYEERTPRCGHTHPEKGPCLREPHPSTPRTHDYTHKVESVRAPARFDARIGA